MLDLKGYEWALVEGAWVTLQVALLSLLVAVVLGLLAALARLSDYRVAKGVATLYTTVIRGIPDLVLMMLIFFGGQMLLNNSLYGINEWLNNYFTAQDPNHEWVSYLPDYIEISPFIAGVATIGFIFGAYMAETFRGAILAVDSGELEAGKAFGMSRGQVFRRILLPQMIRHAIPGFGNNWLVLMKTTALVSIIGLDDVVRKGALAAGTTQMPFTFYLAISLVFLFFTALSTTALNWVERKYSLHTR